jgi:FRG domain-containing protein
LKGFLKKKKCGIEEYFCREYYRILLCTRPAVSSLTGNNYKLPYDSPDKFEYDGLKAPPGYAFMIYVRHHGFPSPLLDWTRSPYVAAFFAFNEAKESDEVAIYSFREYDQNAKLSSPAEPTIRGLGPYVETHKRHYQQQCEYTICIKIKDGESIYCCHEDAKFGEKQDVLTKYILPGKERKKVIEKLDFMNINEFSLFGNEESLMSTLANREIERR